MTDNPIRAVAEAMFLSLLTPETREALKTARAIVAGTWRPEDELPEDEPPDEEEERATRLRRFLAASDEQQMELMRLLDELQGVTPDPA